MKLSVNDHDRDAAGMTYVYPVLSRRAGGVSLGVNLSPNNACNFRCVYCQVPNLVAGNAPPIDVDQLRDELQRLLTGILSGETFDTEAGPAELRDVAISGNGEPTSSRQLGEVVGVVGEELAANDLLGRIPVVLITNGSLMLKDYVGAALATLSQIGGEVWFKMDSATDAGIQRINGSAIGRDGQMERLIRSAELCRTLLQVCLFSWHGAPPPEEEVEALVERMSELRRRRVPVEAVLLYGLARPSSQPEAGELSALNAEWMESFAERIRATGMPVRVFL